VLRPKGTSSQNRVKIIFIAIEYLKIYYGFLVQICINDLVCHCLPQVSKDGIHNLHQAVQLAISVRRKAV
jgi:hypothetical protein